MAGPRVALTTDVLTVGIFANVYIMRVHGEIRMDALEAAHRVHLDLAARVGNTAVLTLAAYNSPIPDSTVREASSRMMRELAPHLLAGATVIEGGGFWASAVRSFLTAVYFVAKQPCPTKAFADVEEASNWLAPRVGQIPSQVMGAAHYVMKQTPVGALPNGSAA